MNKDILQSKFVKKMKEVTDGGNISYLLTTEEVYPYLNTVTEVRTIPMNFDASALVGRYFIVTGSGRYFKNVLD